MESQTRGHVILAVVLATMLIVICVAIVLFIYKKSDRHPSIPGKFNTFDNPLFFGNERAQPDVVDTNKLLAYAEEEKSGSVITL